MIHIKCRICTCCIDTVRLAQLNRIAKEVAAQKEATEFVNRPFDQVGRDVSRTGFFVTGAEDCERGSECMYKYMIDRASN